MNFALLEMKLCLRKSKPVWSQRLPLFLSKETHTSNLEKYQNISKWKSNLIYAKYSKISSLEKQLRCRAMLLGNGDGRGLSGHFHLGSPSLSRESQQVETLSVDPTPEKLTCFHIQI